MKESQKDSRKKSRGKSLIECFQHIPDGVPKEFREGISIGVLVSNCNGISKRIACGIFNSEKPEEAPKAITLKKPGSFKERNPERNSKKITGKDLAFTMIIN